MYKVSNTALLARKARGHHLHLRMASWCGLRISNPDIQVVVSEIYTARRRGCRCSVVISLPLLQPLNQTPSCSRSATQSTYHAQIISTHPLTIHIPQRSMPVCTHPYNPNTSPKIKINTMPTKIRLCCIYALTPLSPTTPMLYPAAIPVRPTERPQARCMQPLKRL